MRSRGFNTMDSGRSARKSIPADKGVAYSGKGYRERLIILTFIMYKCKKKNTTLVL